MNNIRSLCFLSNKSQKGMTFLEVLVALVIIVTGILGAVAMQATAKQASFDAMQRSLASSLAQNIISRIRSNAPINRVLYVGSDYGANFDADDAPDPRCSTLNDLCNSTALVANDLYEWQLALTGWDVTSNNKNRAGLVNGRGCISINANALTVVVSWSGRSNTSDQEKNSCGVEGAKRRQVVVDAFII